MSRPKVIRQGRKLQIRRETNRRQNVSVVYPILSKNGSVVTIDGTDRGIRISWTGGRSLYYGASDDLPPTNRDHNTDSASTYTSQPQSEDEALFESDGEDSEDECRHKVLVQDIELLLGNSVQGLATPSTSPDNHYSLGAETAEFAQDHIVAAATLEDGSTRIISLPLDPPSAATKRKRRFGANIYSLETKATNVLLRDIALTFEASNQGSEERHVGRPQTRRSTEQSHNTPSSILAAVATSELSGQLLFFRVPLTSHRSGRRHGDEHATAFHVVNLEALPTRITFNPAPSPLPRQMQLLVADIAGTTSVFDLSSQQGTRSSTESTEPQWLIHFAAPYSSISDASAFALAHRQKVLSAVWCLDGMAALVLLEDGTFGLYNISAPAPPAKHTTPSPLSFACSGFIGDAPENSATGSAVFTGSKPKRAHLAPMTPNTRRTKSEKLFSGAPVQSSGAARGGIASLPISGKNGAFDDAIVLWYGTRLFAIPSLQAYWTRSTSRESGSLYGAGITVLDEVDLSGEIITSVNILPTPQSLEPQVLGAGAWKHDVQVSGEYKTVVLSTMRPREKSTTPADDDHYGLIDRRLLQRGELSVEGMDRMLDSMVGVEPTSRRVGFAES